VTLLYHENLRCNSPNTQTLDESLGFKQLPTEASCSATSYADIVSFLL